MKRTVIALLLGLALCLTMIPTAWAEPVQVNVSANIDGAEIYLNGEFTRKVTPAALTAAVGDVVSLSLPGYVAAAQTVSGAGDMDFTLSPELYPSAYAGHVQEYTVENTDQLRDALTAAAAQDEDSWTLIYLQEDAADHYGGMHNMDGPDLYHRAHHYTIYGGESGVDCPLAINLYGTEGVRLVNLRFTNAYATQLTFRVPGNNDSEDHVLSKERPAINTRDVYILGCTFTNGSEFGIYQCVPIYCGGVDYEGNGTVNWYGIHFSNNDVTGQLFNFAAAGDGDYNTIRDYTVCANRFTKGSNGSGVAFLCADAHSWYVYENSGSQYSGNMAAGEFESCDHNRMEDILVSGNDVRNGTISLQAANLGNQYNAVRRAVIRNNTVTNDAVITGPKAAQGDRWASALSIRTAVVADNYGEEMTDYPQYMVPDFSHTDYNVVEDVTVVDNVFQAGYDRGVDICCLETNVGWQCGKGNVIRNVTVENNAFFSAFGINIGCYGNYVCNAKSSTCADNLLEDVHFRNNSVTRLEEHAGDFGILVAGQYVARHGEYRSDPDTYPPYSGETRDVEICGNTVTGYDRGIIITGAAGDYARNMTVHDVDVIGNTVVNQNFHEWPLMDIGILAAGSTLQTGIDGYKPLCNRNCVLENVTIRDNDVTALIGIAAAGLVTTRQVDYTSDGNIIRNVSITGNTLTQRTLYPGKNENENFRAAAILTGDVFSPGCAYRQVAEEQWEQYDKFLEPVLPQSNALSGDRGVRVVVSGNTCNGFVENFVNGCERTVYTDWDAVDSGTPSLYRCKRGDALLYSAYVPYAGGDLDEDGELSVMDMQRLFEYLSQNTVPTDAQAAPELTTAYLAALDLDGDGTATILDYQCLYQMMLAWQQA